MESKESRLLDPSNWMPVLLRQVSCPHYYWSETQIYSVSTYMRSHQSNSTHTFLRTESKLVITALPCPPHWKTGVHLAPFEWSKRRLRDYCCFLLVLHRLESLVLFSNTVQIWCSVGCQTHCPYCGARQHAAGGGQLFAAFDCVFP